MNVFAWNRYFAEQVVVVEPEVAIFVIERYDALVCEEDLPRPMAAMAAIVSLTETISDTAHVMATAFLLRVSLADILELTTCPKLCGSHRRGA